MQYAHILSYQIVHYREIIKNIRFSSKKPLFSLFSSRIKNWAKILTYGLTYPFLFSCIYEYNSANYNPIKEIMSTYILPCLKILKTRNPLFHAAFRNSRHKKTTSSEVVHWAGLQGFEPWNDGVRVRCLTVWR